MNRACLATGLTLALLAAGCTQQPGGSVPGEEVAATVDGKTISANTFDHYVQGVAGKPAEDLSDEERAELLDNLVRATVIAGEAERKGIAASEETQAVLELQRLSILQQAVSKDYLQDRLPSEEELRGEYDLQVAQMDKTQYRASHILVPTEEAAKQAIAQLRGGAKFAQLASALSTDTASAQKGGDLDWFSVSNMTPSFAQAVIGLKKGETTTEPVKSDFGWHVIWLMDTREATAPPFDAVRDRLVQIVERKKFDAYTDGLVEKAKITKTP